MGRIHANHKSLGYQILFFTRIRKQAAKGVTSPFLRPRTTAAHISSRAGAAQVEALAEEVGMHRKVDPLDIMQFLVANMLEWTCFDGSKRRDAFEELVTRY